MRFAAEEWLWSMLFAVALACVLVAQGYRVMAARRKFGNESQVASLVTAKTGARHASSGILLVLSIALFGLAAAGPQYGKGTRVLPATNLDVVLVLDYSKSMYARDVSPSRIERAKIEVRRLVRELAGARFAAVAFAGDTLSFPLTSDGAAISQFFRGLTPNDMPIGGTAIARALEAGRQLLSRDPRSQRHEQVIVLVTDGEDLEGDPVASAEAVHADGIRVEVVQIGGRSPEPIPNIGADGKARGMRKDARGQIITTSLSREGEAELQRLAQAGGGEVVRAEGGSVGIDTITSKLRRLMTEELSERVETVFADVYHFPLSLGAFLLLLEAFIGTAPRRRWIPDPPKQKGRTRVPRRRHVATAAMLSLALPGCAAFDSLFERESPVVNEAISALENGEPDRATQLLTEYLETGPCSAGEIGAGDRAREKGDASFDLALAFAASFDADSDAPGQQRDPSGAPSLQGQGQGPGGTEPGEPIEAPRLECAQRLLSLVATNPEHPAALRARARYLAGNLELRRKDLEAAIEFYDQALGLAPGVPEGDGDPVGVDTAYNRALALRLLDEKRKQEQQEQQEQEQNKSNQQDDGEQDEQDDESKEDGEQDQQDDESKEDGEQDQQDDESEEDGEQDDEQKQDQQGEAKDERDQQGKPEEEDGRDETPDEGQERPTPRDQANGKERQAKTDPSASQDQRILDLLEQAPTLQQHEARERSRSIRSRSTMEDK